MNDESKIIAPPGAKPADDPPASSPDDLNTNQPFSSFMGTLIANAVACGTSKVNLNVNGIDMDIHFNEIPGAIEQGVVFGDLESANRPPLIVGGIGGGDA